MMMLNGEDTIIGSEIMLQDTDFPVYFKDQHHPEDFIPMLNPKIDLILHKKPFHNRLFARICFLTEESTYLPFTFILDTGAPEFLYLSEKTKIMLNNRIKKDDGDHEYIKFKSECEFHGKKIPVNDTPSHHNNINIMGLKLLLKFELCLNEEGIMFNKLPIFL